MFAGRGDLISIAVTHESIPHTALLTVITIILFLSSTYIAGFAASYLISSPTSSFSDPAPVSAMGTLDALTGASSTFGGYGSYSSWGYQSGPGLAGWWGVVEQAVQTFGQGEVGGIIREMKEMASEMVFGSLGNGVGEGRTEMERRRMSRAKRDREEARRRYTQTGESGSVEPKIETTFDKILLRFSLGFS